MPKKIDTIFSTTTARGLLYTSAMFMLLPLSGVASESSPKMALSPELIFSVASLKSMQNNGNAQNFDLMYNTQFNLLLKTIFNPYHNFVSSLAFTHHSSSNGNIAIDPYLGSKATEGSTSVDLDLSYLQSKIGNWQTKIGVLPTRGSDMYINRNMIENASYGGIAHWDASELLRFKMPVHIDFLFSKSYALDNNRFFYKENRLNNLNSDYQGIFYNMRLPSDESMLVSLSYLNRGNIKALSSSFTSENALSNSASESHQSLGDIAYLGASFSLSDFKLFGAKASLNLSYTHSNPAPTGKCINYSDTNISGCFQNVGVESSGGPSGEAYYGSMQNEPGNMIAIELDIKDTVYSNLDYAFSYNRGSQYWISNSSNSRDAFNKYATRGDAFELKATRHLVGDIVVSGSYLFINNKYEGSGMHYGVASAVNETLSGVNIALESRF